VAMGVAMGRGGGVKRMERAEADQRKLIQYLDRLTLTLNHYHHVPLAQQTCNQLANSEAVGALGGEQTNLLDTLPRKYATNIYSICANHLIFL
jgi:hypothetical protein